MARSVFASRRAMPDRKAKSVAKVPLMAMARMLQQESSAARLASWAALGPMSQLTAAGLLRSAETQSEAFRFGETSVKTVPA
jgi:hypothetical protein